MPSLFPWGCYLSHKRFFYVLIVIDLIFKSSNIFMLLFTLMALFMFIYNRSFKEPTIKMYAGLRFAISILFLILLCTLIVAFLIISRGNYGVDPEVAIVVVSGLFLVLTWDIYLSWKFLEFLKRVEDHEMLPQSEKRSMFSELI